MVRATPHPRICLALLDTAQTDAFIQRDMFRTWRATFARRLCLAHAACQPDMFTSGRALIK
eukprot:1969236-Pleurochrysis_carterae.AAC.1